MCSLDLMLLRAENVYSQEYVDAKIYKILDANYLRFGLFEVRQ